MRILIAEDDRISRNMLEALLVKWGHEVITTCDGNEAWEIMKKPDSPRLAILDWMMPGYDGVQLCHLIREKRLDDPVYLILLTALGSKQNIVNGLEAGADDYIVKPFDRAELKARINGGERLINLQLQLAERVKELQAALKEVKALRGLVPICSYCKKVRDDKNYWQQVEQYVAERTEARFTHGVCPECFEKYVQPEITEFLNNHHDHPHDEKN